MTREELIQMVYKRIGGDTEAAMVSATEYVDYNIQTGGMLADDVTESAEEEMSAEEAAEL
jgi:hypothetical protein